MKWLLALIAVVFAGITATSLKPEAAIIGLVCAVGAAILNRIDQLEEEV